MRVLLTLPVSIRSASSNGAKFEEATHTLVVNAHGALVTLATPVTRGQLLVITNKATQAKVDCKVVFVGHGEGGKTQVGVEFSQPSASFWQVNFPPDDWGT